jgi:hypothetical protein
VTVHTDPLRLCVTTRLGKDRHERSNLVNKGKKGKGVIRKGPDTISSAFLRSLVQGLTGPRVGSSS